MKKITALLAMLISCFVFLSGCQTEKEPEKVLPEDRVWIDELRDRLVKKDYEAVLKVLEDDAIEAKIEPYLDTELIFEDTGNIERLYRLVCTDGTIVGLHIGKVAEKGAHYREAFYSKNAESDYGMLHVDLDDVWVKYWSMDDKTRTEWEWFDGSTKYFSNGETADIRGELESIGTDIWIDWFYLR